MNNALTVSRRGFGLGAAAFGLLLVSGCSRGSGSEGGGLGSGSGKLTLAYNSDGPHKTWAEAVCHSVSNVLGITMEPLPVAQFSEMRSAITKHTLLGAFRSGWSADYPSLENFLNATFQTGASANDAQYSSKTFDDLLAQAAAATDPQTAYSYFRQAQSQLFTDLPGIPLWYQNGFGGYSRNASNVDFDWRAIPVYEEARSSANGGVILANNTEPQNSLLPTNTNEFGGGRVLDLIYAGLIRYDKDGNVINEVASSIETTDNQHFTITLKPGWTFSDGSPVTADSFIKAWKFGALLSNAQLGSSFFERIKGFSYDEDSELTGLTKVNDLTFTVELNAPASDFKISLGHYAYYPMPESAFKDIKAYGNKPVGNGPYRLVSWDHDSRMVLETNPAYAGGRTVANKGVTFKLYTSYDSVYNDLLADAIDIADSIPDSFLPIFQKQLGERAINKPAAYFQGLAIDVTHEHWKMDEEGRARRAAICRAIDRKLICDKLYYGTRTPAKDFTAPTVAGWTADVPGNEVLTYDPDEARRLWARAEAISKF